MMSAHFDHCKLPVEMCPRCRRHLAEVLMVEGKVRLMGCNVEGCDRTVHARGLCGKHYQQWRTGRDPYAAAPRPVDAPGWAPPSGLSAQWHDRNTHRPTQGRSCALEACAGTAAPGSPYCPPHKAYRAAQERLKVRGLA